MVKLPIEESKGIVEGRHTAVISDVKERLEPYHYIDVYFKLEDGTEIKEGYPATINENTKFGKLLKSLGTSLDVGKFFETTSMKGEKVTLMTINEVVKDKGTFARVVDGSVKLSPSTKDPFKNARLDGNTG